MIKGCSNTQLHLHSFFFNIVTWPPQLGKTVLNHLEFPGPVVFKLDIHLKSPEDLVKTQATICIYKFQVILILLVQRPDWRSTGLT